MADLALDIHIAALDDDFDLDAVFTPSLGGGLGFLDHLGPPLAAYETVGQADGEAVLTECGRGQAGSRNGRQNHGFAQNFLH